LSWNEKHSRFFLRQKRKGSQQETVSGFLRVLQLQGFENFRRVIKETPLSLLTVPGIASFERLSAHAATVIAAKHAGLLRPILTYFATRMRSSGTGRFSNTNDCERSPSWGLAFTASRKVLYLFWRKHRGLRRITSHAGTLRNLRNKTGSRGPSLSVRQTSVRAMHGLQHEPLPRTCSDVQHLQGNVLLNLSQLSRESKPR
jgi:hypothetical protein